MLRISLLNVPIDVVTRTDAVDTIVQMLASSSQRHVMTPNSEMLVEAHRNKEFRRVLQQSDLNLPDSHGLLWAARYTGQCLPERVTGVDTVRELCKHLDAHTSVFLLGAGDGIAEKAAKKLQQKNPHLKIVGTFSGSPRQEDAEAIIQKINAAKPHLLLVAYGAPAQDIWIADHLKHMPSVRVAMGIGGTFDFIAGIQKRAPQILQKLGLEWMWRLVRQPSRLPRIFTAVVVFPLLVMHSRARVQ